MSLTEQLSRLLDHELPEPEAEALRRRIATEPEVAALWARLCALPGALADLPDPAPPPHLVAAVLRTPARPRRAWPSLGLGAAAGALLAASLLLALRPSAAPVLIAGTQLISGDLDVRAAGHTVAVHGEAALRVEPNADALRVIGAKEDPMIRDALIGAAAGALLTVAVYEGKAVITGPDDTTTTVLAGQTQVFGPGDDAGPGTAQAAPAGRRTVVVGGGPADLAARVSELEEQNSKLALELAVARGQVQAHEGKSIPWPKDAPAALRPDAFEAFVRARVAKIPGASLAELDCSEYPCIAVLSTTSTDPDWQVDLAATHDEMSSAGFGDQIRVMGAGMQRDDEQGHVSRLYGFTVVPGEGGDDDTSQRAGYRLRTLMEDGASAEETP